MRPLFILVALFSAGCVGFPHMSNRDIVDTSNFCQSNGMYATPLKNMDGVIIP